MTHSLVSIRDISYAWWNEDAPEDHSRRTIDDLTIVFEGLSLDIPEGITSIAGPNGIGKSTLLLLAAGRIFPQKGRVSVLGTDTVSFLGAKEDPAIEERRNKLVSVIYQNMEFDSDESLGDLLARVAAEGAWDTPAKAASALGDVAEALDISHFLHRKTQDLAKGELQRAVIALAVSYGSKVLMMDEPVFAMEERHKLSCFAYLRSYCRANGRSLVYTAHDLHICKDFADRMLLMGKDKTMLLGPVNEIARDEIIEDAYGVPMATLYQRERLYRDMLLGRLGGKGPFTK